MAAVGAREWVPGTDGDLSCTGKSGSERLAGHSGLFYRPALSCLRGTAGIKVFSPRVPVVQYRPVEMNREKVRVKGRKMREYIEHEHTAAGCARVKTRGFAARVFPLLLAVFFSLTAGLAAAAGQVPAGEEIEIISGQAEFDRNPGLYRQRRCGDPQRGTGDQRQPSLFRPAGVGKGHRCGGTHTP